MSTKPAHCIIALARRTPALNNRKKMQSLNGVVRVFRTTPMGGSLWARGSCSKLFVGGLSYDTNETVLKNAFEKHGEIIEGNFLGFLFRMMCFCVLRGKKKYVGILAVRVICHHVSGKSKGYGFVRFASEDAADAALKEMHSQVCLK
ncbi:hypothetical protein PTKIN_Ptkin07bG0245500 [Pterospermum kingtungense]